MGTPTVVRRVHKDHRGEGFSRRIMSNHPTHCMDCRQKTHTYIPVEGGKVCPPCKKLREMKERNATRDAEYNRVVKLIAGGRR